VDYIVYQCEFVNHGRPKLYERYPIGFDTMVQQLECVLQ
jgi:hypothetical protein